MGIGIFCGCLWNRNYWKIELVSGSWVSAKWKAERMFSWMVCSAILPTAPIS